MNKKGFTAIAVFMAIIYFMIAMVLYQFIKPDIAIQRGASYMNCSSPDTEGDMAVCLILDGIIPFIIIVLISIAGGIATEKAIT